MWSTKLSKRVLIVDDDFVTAISASTMFIDLGYETTIALSGEEAIDILNGQNTFDLVFSDIVMPGGINGIDLSQRINKSNPGLTVLLTTGCSDTGRKALLRFPVVSKPYGPSDLTRALTALPEGV
jgi:CheY-like chemotaxis protein